MDNPSPASSRLSDEQAQQLVLSTVTNHAESLLRVAYRHSLCDDDAHDAYQRSMEILLRRAPTLDPRSVHKWMAVVVKHEALDVRRTRSAAVAAADVDYDLHEARELPSPEERALTVDRATHAAEALRRLKPQELRALWLKALGHSYAEIGALTGFSATKVNRCITEGRKSFLERFEGIETGAECERWQPVLSAIVDGEATSEQMSDARPHLRNCAACRATLRGLHDVERPLAAVLPLGLVAVGSRLSGLVDRLVPGGAGGVADVAAGAGGAGVLGAGGMKLAGLLATGAIAVGGGTAVVHERTERHGTRPATTAAAHERAPRPAASRSVRARTPALRASTTKPRASVQRVVKVVRRPRQHRVAAPQELKPLGHEVEAAAPVAAPAAVPASTTPSPKAEPIAAPVAHEADSSAGEFAPQP